MSAALGAQACLGRRRAPMRIYSKSTNHLTCLSWPLRALARGLPVPLFQLACTWSLPAVNVLLLFLSSLFPPPSHLLLIRFMG